MDFEGNIFLIWLCYSSQFTEVPENLLIMSRAQSKRRFCNRAALTLGPDDPADPTVLEVSVAEKDVWSFVRPL